MDLVKGDPTWIKVDDRDKIPPTNDWTFDDLCKVMRGVFFQPHSCGKYTLIYRAEITLRRESGSKYIGQEHLVVDVGCQRDNKNLRYAGNLQKLEDLPVQEFTVYERQCVVSKYF